jgi:hypothetical protein
MDHFYSKYEGTWHLVPFHGIKLKKDSFCVLANKRVEQIPSTVGSVFFRSLQHEPVCKFF